METEVKIICPECRKEIKYSNVKPDFFKKKLVTCPNTKGKGLARCGKTFEHDFSLPMMDEDIEGGTEIVISESGYLLTHEHRYVVKMDKQIVGRLSGSPDGNSVKEGMQANPPKKVPQPADLQIDTSDKRMHRNHFIIDTQPDQNGIYVSRLYRAPGSVNLLSVESPGNASLALYVGDVEILHDGQVIQAGETKMTYKVSESLKIANARALAVALAKRAAACAPPEPDETKVVRVSFKL